MGIKSGSGRNSVDRSGDRMGPVSGIGSRRRKQQQLPPPPPKKPLRPVEDPFPEYKGLRLGQYRVLEERDDYLLCTGYDPNAKNPASEVTPSAFRTGVLLKIAKPWALQRTFWEAGPVTIGGVEYTFDYSDTEYGVRTAYWTDDDGVDQEEEQRISIPYVTSIEFDPPKVGDLLVAVQIRKSAAVDGTNVTDEDGVRLRWMDLNVSGRHWKSVITIPQVIRFEITIATDSTEAEATIDQVRCDGTIPDPATVTVYDALGCFLDEDPLTDLVGRKGYAIRMDNGVDSCRYEIISLCCPPA